MEHFLKGSAVLKKQYFFLKPATSKNQRDIDIHRHMIRDEQCQT